MQNQYPKTFTHRDDHMSSVVVMNADQEAQLPIEYLPALTGGAGQTVSAADHAADVMLSPEYAQLLVDREALERDRAAFAEMMAGEGKEMAAARDKLEADRNELTEGYKGAMAKLEADRAEWEASKYAQAPEGTSDTASAPAPAADEPAAGPAKRVRTAKAD